MMVWDGLVAVDLFCAGLGAWMFIFTAVASWKNEGKPRVKLVGYLVAAVLVALGALILAVDAKGGFNDPVRYFYLLSNFGSVMTWGVLFISLFLVAAAVAIIMLLAKKRPVRAVEWVAIVCGVGVSVYTGVLLGVSSAYPLWNMPLLPLVFLVSAAYCGWAAYALVAKLCGGDEYVTPACFGKAALVLPVLEAVLIAVLVAVTAAAGGSDAAAGAATVATLLSGAYAPLFWLGLIVVGLVVPFALQLLSQRRGAEAPAWMGYAMWACVLVGGFVLRYLVVMAAVPLFA